jgi:AraC-like DNA-binding protein
LYAHLYAMLYTFGVFIAFFLSLLILTKRGRNGADTILGIWMIVIGIHLLSYYSFKTGIIYRYPFIVWLNFPLPYFHGPLLFLYTLALTSPIPPGLRKVATHFILPVFILCLYAPFMTYSHQQKLEIIHSNGKGFELQALITTILLSSSGIFYIYITHRLLYNHQKRILDQFSYQEKINLQWLRFLFYGMGIMWVLIIIIGNDDLIFSASTVFVVLIGYFGIKQVGIFTNQPNEVAENDLKEEPVPAEVTVGDATDQSKRKYAKSGLNEESANDLHLRLKHLMVIEKLFTEPELTLADLSGRLGVHSNYLSQVINEMEGVNFYDYINSLRVEEFKRLALLPENQKYTLLALAFECGFNSKSAFNRCFKKATDLSPSEYVKQLTEKSFL